MPYILSLKVDRLSRSEFKKLLWREKDEEGFSSLIDFLHTIKVPSYCYKSIHLSYHMFLFLNLSTDLSLSYVQIPYIVAQKTVCMFGHFALNTLFHTNL